MELSNLIPSAREAHLYCPAESKAKIVYAVSFLALGQMRPSIE